MSSQPDDADRYTARPLGWGDWFVWDTRQNAPVFGMDTLREGQAREAARRLSQAYRRAMSPVDCTAAQAPSADARRTQSSRAAGRYPNSSPRAPEGSSSRRSSSGPWFALRGATKTLPEACDDHRRG